MKTSLQEIVCQLTRHKIKAATFKNGKVLNVSRKHEKITTSKEYKVSFTFYMLGTPAAIVETDDIVEKINYLNNTYPSAEIKMEYKKSPRGLLQLELSHT